MSKILNVDENKYIKETAIMQAEHVEMFIKERRMGFSKEDIINVQRLSMAAIFNAIDTLISDGVLEIIKK